MRVLFLGSPAYAVPVAEALVQDGHDLVGVVTQPDKPMGRGRQLVPTPVRAWAEARGLTVLRPTSLRPSEVVDRLAALRPEAIVVAAYGRILPPAVLDLPPLRCLNVHPSLLPLYRGPSPVVETLLQGDTVTGVTVMLMDQGMDTGPILAQEQEPVLPEDTVESLTWRLFEKGAGLLARTLPAWVRGDIEPAPQDNDRATYSRLLQKEDGALDWASPAEHLEAQVRAYNPWPGSYTSWGGRTLKLLSVSALSADIPSGASPGMVVQLSEVPLRVGVVTGKGVLEIRQLQLEGKRPVGVEQFLQGYPSFVDSRLPS